jgi:hypothetical protein
MREKQERYVLWQRPNLAIMVWFGAVVLGKLFEQGRVHEVLSLVSFGALFTWAWLEIFQGVNNFRRVLGAIVLIFSIYSRIN